MTNMANLQRFALIGFPTCKSLPTAETLRLWGRNLEMYACFNEVYNDMWKISCVDQLNHAVSLKMFMQKLPSEDSAMKYVKFKMLQ